jgi:hypothetical protein
VEKPNQPKNRRSTRREIEGKTEARRAVPSPRRRRQAPSESGIVEKLPNAQPRSTPTNIQPEVARRKKNTDGRDHPGWSG